MSVLIKNGRIITATDDYFADIFIEGETIHSIGKNLDVKADQTIDVWETLMPGGIDPHVHLDMPFMGTYSSDNYETGTACPMAERQP
jgi:dihydropyrimidinase